VLTFQSLLVGGNPFATTSVYCLIAFLERQWGVHFPIGGTGRFVQGLVGLIEGQGGRVRCAAEVAQITVDRGAASGVRMAGGETLAADVVVSNCDSAWTYRHLLAPEHRHRWTDRRIERARYSMSLFVWYFGTNRRYEDVAHHTIVLGPRYRELLGDIFDRPPPTRRSRPTAATGSTCSRRCRIWVARPTGARPPSRIDRRSRRGSKRRCCRACTMRS
jgi:phytoene desaturase